MAGTVDVFQRSELFAVMLFRERLPEHHASESKEGRLAYISQDA